MDNTTKYCIKCGKAMGAGASFCGNCGNVVNTSSAVQPAYSQQNAPQVMPAATQQPVYPQQNAPQVTPAAAQQPVYPQQSAPQVMPTATQQPVYPQQNAPQVTPAAAQQPVYPQQSAPQAMPAAAQQPVYPQQSAPQVMPTAAQQPAYPQPSALQADFVQKKSKTPMVVITILVLVALFCVLMGFLANAFLLAPMRYDWLKEDIVLATSVAEVLEYQTELQEFQEENPDLVGAELNELMQACNDYEQADESEARYRTMLETLSRLQVSRDSAVANTAATLQQEVSEAYVSYVESIGGEISQDTQGDWDTWMDEVLNGLVGSEGGQMNSDTQAGPSEPFDFATMPLQTVGDGLGVWSDEDGERYVSFDADNVSGKDIVYFEIIAFFYDESGNPFVAGDGNTWEYFIDSGSILEAGDGHWADVNGYWECREHSQATYMVPIVIYTEYADGSSWGEYFDVEPTQEFANMAQEEANSIMEQSL